ncbi:hypothetical protein DFH29DRAFT_880627 [Suillus ampliporus]|nr:hypothetical protein DFH29DRAFT_880627 [Suillus ampliporus]
MDYAQSDAAEYVPNMPPSQDFMSAIKHDPIVTVHTIVHVLRASGLQQQCFSDIVKATKQTDLQLLHDYVVYVLDISGLKLNFQAIDWFLDSHDFLELKKYKLNEVEWQALNVFKDIPSVPHAFQQKLSSKKTPTLYDAIPSFEAMSQVR